MCEFVLFGLRDRALGLAEDANELFYDYEKLRGRYIMFSDKKVRKNLEHVMAIIEKKWMKAADKFNEYMDSLEDDNPFKV